jgi:hypothetical protein
VVSVVVGRLEKLEAEVQVEVVAAVQVVCQNQAVMNQREILLPSSLLLLNQTVMEGQHHQGSLKWNQVDYHQG